MIAVKSSVTTTSSKAKQFGLAWTEQPRTEPERNTEARLGRRAPETRDKSRLAVLNLRICRRHFPFWRSQVWLQQGKGQYPAYDEVSSSSPHFGCHHQTCLSLALPLAVNRLRVTSVRLQRGEATSVLERGNSPLLLFTGLCTFIQRMTASVSVRTCGGNTQIFYMLTARRHVEPFELCVSHPCLWRHCSRILLLGSMTQNLNFSHLVRL